MEEFEFHLGHVEFEVPKGGHPSECDLKDLKTRPSKKPPVAHWGN